MSVRGSDFCRLGGNDDTRLVFLRRHGVRREEQGRIDGGVVEYPRPERCQELERGLGDQEVPEFLKGRLDEKGCGDDLAELATGLQELQRPLDEKLVKVEVA